MIGTSETEIEGRAILIQKSFLFLLPFSLLSLPFALGTGD